MILEQIEIDLQGSDTLTLYIDVFDNSLARKWLQALNVLLRDRYHLEKNYCFFGFAQHKRDGWYLVDKINESIQAINDAQLGYHIEDRFDMQDLMDGEQKIKHQRFNLLHRYFEDLQGVSGDIRDFYRKADPETRWHIRQLNLLCHEFESWALSYRKKYQAPEWQRPSQLMCWLNSPRFELEPQDLELFGIHTINRPTGAVYVGVNKAVGKHHWEVFHDEGRDSRVSELTTTTMRSQSEAAGDFDIEWARDPSQRDWQIRHLQEFRQWLIDNGFDPDDPALTIGHPQIGQVDLIRSFGTEHPEDIWLQLEQHLDVAAIRTSTASADYPYCWSDPDFKQQQIAVIIKGEY
jgi:hypothetical protein